MTRVVTHVLIGVGGADRLDEPARLEAILRKAALATGASILQAHFHHFGEVMGVTGVLMLGESHISIHAWSDIDFAAPKSTCAGWRAEPSGTKPRILPYLRHVQGQSLVRWRVPAVSA